jgi:NitT/TauT family transport system substrate-binding protein
MLATPVVAADKVHLQTDWIPSGEHAMYFGGWTKGFWEEQGIDINITRGYGSGDTVTKIAGGAADFGIADIGALITARARTGVPVKQIMQTYTHSPHSLFVLKSSGITTFQGLEDKKIGITPGNSHRVYFPKVAERAGTDPSKIIWSNSDASAMAALLISKKIDAAPFFAMHHYYQNKAAMRAGEEIVVLPFVETGFAIYATGLVARDDMIEENPDLVRRFLIANRNAMEWARDNREEACTLHVERVPEVAHDDCMGSLNATMTFVFNDHSSATGLGRHDPARLAFTYEVVADAQDLPADWDYSQVVDHQFVP